ncbi:MAG TPA: helix-turn-helix domain-containing protein [Thermoanaerobaculia bacterium]
MKAPEPQQQPTLKENERKWTKPLMDAGYTVIPAVILDRQQALGLDPVDVNILLQLLTHWWKADNLPYPSKKSIAERIGKTEKTVQRRIAKLQHAGFVKRVPRYSAAKGQLSNIYDFSGLIAAATPFANEAVDRRTAIQTEAKTRAKRKRPSNQKFKILTGGEGDSE